MAEGNVSIQAGVKFDTGRKWIDASGVAWRIFQKMFRLGALPNATTISTAHGETIDPLKFFRIAGFWASNGTTIRALEADPVITVDATNINVIATANLSANTSSELLIEFAG